MGRTFLLYQGFDSLPTQRVPPLYYFEILIFWWRTLKIFLIYTPIHDKFEVEARAEKALFWSKLSKKCLKLPFLACFFPKFCLRSCLRQNFKFFWGSQIFQSFNFSKNLSGAVGISSLGLIRAVLFIYGSDF